MITTWLVAVWIGCCTLGGQPGFGSEIISKNIERPLCEKQADHYREIAKLQDLNRQYICVEVNEK